MPYISQHVVYRIHGWFGHNTHTQQGHGPVHQPSAQNPVQSQHNWFTHNPHTQQGPVPMHPPSAPVDIPMAHPVHQQHVTYAQELLLYVWRIVFETEPYEWTGVVNHTATHLHTAFKHTGYTKLYHFLTWYHVWKIHTAGEVFETFLFFNWFIIPIWIFYYVLYFMFVFRLQDWRWRSKRSLLWYTIYVLCHVVFYFCVTFLFFCIQKNIVVSLHVIFEKATQPLTEKEYLIFLVMKDDDTGVATDTQRDTWLVYVLKSTIQINIRISVELDTVGVVVHSLC